jgi:hypothetical protein
VSYETLITLRRIKAGKYQTRDGRFEIVRDPHSDGSANDGARVTWWLTYDNELGTQEGHIFEPVTTLFEARLELSTHIAASGENDERETG